MQNWKKKIMILGLSVSLGAGGLYGCGKYRYRRDHREDRRQLSGESQETVDEAEGSSQVQTEKPETTQAEHPQFVADGIRKVVLVEDGQEIFNLSNEPAGYKMDFDYWEILNPYDETVTVNTETMYDLFDVLCGLDFQGTGSSRCGNGHRDCRFSDQYYSGFCKYIGRY